MAPHPEHFLCRNALSSVVCNTTDVSAPSCFAEFPMQHMRPAIEAVAYFAIPFIQISQEQVPSSLPLSLFTPLSASLPNVSPFIQISQEQVRHAMPFSFFHPSSAQLPYYFAILLIQISQEQVPHSFLPCLSIPSLFKCSAPGLLRNPVHPDQPRIGAPLSAPLSLSSALLRPLYPCPQACMSCSAPH